MALTLTGRLRVDSSGLVALTLTGRLRVDRNGQHVQDDSELTVAV